MTKSREDIVFDSLCENIAAHRFDVPLMPGVALPGRATAIRGPDGTVALLSPGPMDAATVASLHKFGTPSDLIAPSLLHHLYFGDAYKLLPGVRRVAPQRLADKRKDLEFDVFLDDHPTLAGGLVAIAADGAAAAGEWLFYSAAERTLIVTDFVMNVHNARGWLTPTVMRMTGAWKKVAQTRIWRSGVNDREAARRTARILLELDIERLIMAHGEVIDHDGARVLRESLQWLGVD